MEKNTLANTAQARKRVRQSEKARTRNSAQKSNFRTSIKKVLKSLSDKNKDQSNVDFKEAMSAIDKLVIKGLIHKNKAARQKSRLNKKIQELINLYKSLNISNYQKEVLSYSSSGGRVIWLWASSDLRQRLLGAVFN